jgi:hypothetical protein
MEITEAKTEETKQQPNPGGYRAWRLFQDASSIAVGAYCSAFIAGILIGISDRGFKLAALPFLLRPWIMFFVILATFAAHFAGSRRASRFAIIPGLVSLVAFLSILAVGAQDIDVVTAGLSLALFSVVLFVFLSEVLLDGGASYLTRRRGKVWVKELDYLYLALGAIGVFGTLNRVEMLGGRDTKLELLGPAVLAIALVIRLIKTRAEVGGWAELSNASSSS